MGRARGRLATEAAEYSFALRSNSSARGLCPRDGGKGREAVKVNLAARFIAAAFLALGLIAPTSAAGLSGTFINTSENVAILVQIVETDGGALTGRLEQSQLKATGEVETFSLAFYGVTRAGTVVLTLKPSGFTLSGTFDGTVLHLAGEDASFNVRRGEESDFRNAVTQLAVKAVVVRQTLAEREALQQALALNVELADFHRRSIGRLAEIGLFERAIRDTTSRMRAGLEKERGIIGDGQASIARSQISIAISQEEVSASVNYRGAMDTKARVETATADLSARIDALHAPCEKLTSLREPRTFPQWQAMCWQAEDLANEFGFTNITTANAFDSLEETWATEHAAMLAIILDAEAAED